MGKRSAMTSPAEAPRFEARFWEAFEPLRGKLPQAEFRHAVAGLAALKHLSVLFDGRRQELSKQTARRDEKWLDDPSRYHEAGVCWLPAPARWEHLLAKADTRRLGAAVDRAMKAIASGNPPLARMRPIGYAKARFDDDQLAALLRRIEELSNNRRGWDSLVVVGKAYTALLTQFVEVPVKVAADALSAAKLFKDLPLYANGDGNTQHDITTVGPLHMQHPSGKPFFLVPKTNNLQWDPRVVYDGVKYLAVWGEMRGTKGWPLVGCRISPTGKILDPGGFLVHNRGQHLYHRIAAGKDPVTGKPVSLVVWEDRSSWHFDVRGMLVTHDGKVKAFLRTGEKTETVTGNKAVYSLGMPIFPDIDWHLNPWMEYSALGSYGYPDVTFNGKDFVVVCTSGDHVLARMIDPHTGNVRTDPKVAKGVVYPQGKPVTIKIAATKKITYFPQISSGGGKNCLVTWNYTAKAGVGNLWGAKLVFSGNTWKLGKPTCLSGSSEATYGHCEAATNGSGRFMLTWHDKYFAAKKKTKPWQTDWPDVFRMGVGSPAGANTTIKKNPPARYSSATPATTTRGWPTTARTI